jgi:hypothetical protein
MATFTRKCKVTYRAAVMVVTAENEAEAEAKIEAGDWDDIEMDGAELSDWEATGKLEKDD